MSNPTELPDLEALCKIGSLITTQDNRITEAPIFVVEQKTPVISDSDYNDCRVEWRETENGDYQLASPERAECLDALHRAGRDTPGWRRYEVTDVWTFVTACFTEQGCIDYLARNGHNLRETRIYAYGSYRNEEFRAVRSSLIALARRAKPEGEAPQAEVTPFVSATIKNAKLRAALERIIERPSMAVELAEEALSAPAAQQAESGAQAAGAASFNEFWKKRVPAGSDSDHAALFAHEVWQAALAAQSQGAQAAGYFVFEHGCWVATSSDDPRAVKLYRAALAAKAEAPAGCIPVPTNADEAQLMHGLGLNYLQHHAPERLTEAGRAQQAAAPGALDELTALRRLIECAEILDKRPRPMCRDCADEAGTCPNSGLECDMRALLAKNQALYNRLAAPGTPEAPQTAAARDVLAERQRQIEVEGWMPERDDQYEGDELSRAAACYAMSIASENNYFKPLNFWPWDMAWWKPQGTRRNLVKAGALILAEIERLDRAAQLDGGQKSLGASMQPSQACAKSEPSGRLDGGQEEGDRHADQA